MYLMAMGKVLLRDGFDHALALRFLSLQAPKVPPAKSVPAIVEGSGTRCAVQVQREHQPQEMTHCLAFEDLFPWD